MYLSGQINTTIRKGIFLNRCYGIDVITSINSIINQLKSRVYTLLLIYCNNNLPLT